jgi:hypothetical protein
MILETMELPPALTAILAEVHELSTGLIGKWILVDKQLGDYSTFEISNAESLSNRREEQSLDITIGSIVKAKLREEDGRMSADLPNIGSVHLIVQANDSNVLLLSLRRDADSPLETMQASRIMGTSLSPVAERGASWQAKAHLYGVTGALAVRCIFRIIAIIGILHGVLIVVGWIVSRFMGSRIYVTLKVHADYFGPGTKPQLWQKRLGEHNISNIYGFYLPDATWAPGCLPALAMALLDRNYHGVPTSQRMPSLVGV